MPDAVERFEIRVPEPVLDDLRERLARTRWPDQIEGSGWGYGTDLGYLKELCGYWRDEFDWRAQEARLNRFDHWKTPVDGRPLHFVHQRSREAGALPLVITHGWPGKFRAWSDCGGDVESRFTRDELLTNVTIYWVTQTINSSTRLYYETRQSGRWGLGGRRVAVPTGCAIFPKEPIRPPRRWAEAQYDVRRWSLLPSGGHFAALEEPELLVAEIRAFFRDLRPGGLA